MNLKDLAVPFTAKDIEWRIQQSGEKNNKCWAMCLAYVTNRAIMDRLDEVCGPENWKNDFAPAPEGGILCGISIKCGDEWVTKWDGAENTAVEAVKGGLSSAMKRAGSQWGIGRYLYNLDTGFAIVSEKGKHFAKTKKGTAFKWDSPALPSWALPKGEEPQKKEKPKPSTVGKDRQPMSFDGYVSNMEATGDLETYAAWYKRNLDNVRADLNEAEQEQLTEKCSAHGSKLKAIEEPEETTPPF